jgi:hypothetical protein
MKRDLMTTTAFGAVAEYKKRAALQKAEKPANDPLMVRPPSSLELMSSLFEEALLESAQMDVQIKSRITDKKEIELKFSPKNPNSDETKFNLIKILEGLSETEVGKNLNFAPNLGLVTAPSKYALYDFLHELVQETSGLLTPDKFIFRVAEEDRDETYEELFQGYLQLSEDSDAYNKAFERVTTRPYIDYKDYARNLYLTSRVSLSISLGHIYRCIQQEEKLEPNSNDNALFFGGYH